MERSLDARLCKEDPFSGLISNSSWMVGSLLEAQYSCPSVSRGNCFSTRIHQSPTSTGIFAWILHTLIDLLYITTRWCLLPNATKRYVNSSNVLFRENNFYVFSIFFLLNIRHPPLFESADSVPTDTRLMEHPFLNRMLHVLLDSSVIYPMIHSLENQWDSAIAWPELEADAVRRSHCPHQG